MNASNSIESQETGTPVLFSFLCLAVLTLGMLAGTQFLQNRAMKSQLDARQAQNHAQATPSTVPVETGSPSTLHQAGLVLAEARQELTTTAPPEPQPKPPISPTPAGHEEAVLKIHAPSPVVGRNPPSGIAPMVFERLIAADGSLLATDAEFSRTLGRRLFFHVRNGPPIGIDVDTIHPALLQRLALDAAQLKADQTALDTARREAAEAAAKQRLAHAKAERERLEAWRQARLEQQRQNALNADQQVALAALRTAETAALRAQAVPPVIVVQQPAPVWTVPIFWTPVCQPPTPVPQSPTTPSFNFTSSFRFIQQRDNAFDPFVFGRKL